MQGDYGAKIVALLRRLIWLNENEPDIKSLVRHCMMCVSLSKNISKNVQPAKQSAHC